MATLTVCGAGAIGGITGGGAVARAGRNVRPGDIDTAHVEAVRELAGRPSPVAPTGVTDNLWGGRSKQVHAGLRLATALVDDLVATAERARKESQP